MITREILDRTDGTVLSVTSRETRVLAGEPTLWVVAAGSMAVFGAEVEDGFPAGPRRLLFRGGRRAALFTVRGAHARAPRLVAAPVGDAQVLAYTLDEAWAILREEPELVRPLLSSWVASLTAPMAAHGPPRSAVRIEDPGVLTLAPGESARTPEPGLWAIVEAGRVLVRGATETTVSTSDGPVPCAEALWLEAPEGARVRFVLPQDLADSAALRAGLVRLEALALEELERRRSEEEAAERARLRERAARQARHEAGATRELERSLAAEGVAPERATPLLTAVGAILDTLDVEVRPAGAAEIGRRHTDEVDAVARASGVRIRRVLLDGTWWEDDCGPLLAFQGEARTPVALLPDARLRYALFDPIERASTPLTPELAATLDPKAITWYRPLPARKLGLRDLLRYSLHGRTPDLVRMAGTAALATLLGMVLPLATAAVMDTAIPGANPRLLLELGLALLAAGLGQTVFRLAQGFLAVRMAARARTASLCAVWDRLLGLRPAFFRRFASGDLLDRAMAVHTVGERLSGATLGALFAGLMALLNFGLLCVYSAGLALLAALVALLCAVAAAIAAGLIRKRAVALREADGALTGFKVQAVQGAAKLRVAAAERRVFTQWMRRFSERTRLAAGIARVEDGAAVASLVLSSLSTVALFGLAYGRLGGGTSGGLSLGAFLAFMAAYGTFVAGATSLSNTLVGLFDTLTVAGRIQPILDEIPETSGGLADPGPLAGGVSVEHVTFRYREDGPQTLADVSVHAEPGEFVAIVGPSGGGKSTLLRLLLGFESPSSGAVYYDGMDLTGLDVRAVRRQLGIVLQGSRLGQGSVRQNLSAGGELSLEEAWDAVRKAGLEPDLRAMPMGLDTIVSEGGTNLSGGQRQRLLIARALVHRPKLILFDEATSALDSTTQAIVNEELARMNVTRMLIAHRLSTVRGADRIYVMDRGRVVQAGTFEELSAAEGLFARMLARQLA